MKTRAAVAFEAGKPLEVCEVDLEGPKEGEVLVEIKATSTPDSGSAVRMELTITNNSSWERLVMIPRSETETTLRSLRQ